ncbi:MAG: integral rane protein TerC family [Bacteroidota bacterium]|jgi:tellurite resistance protein TerC|nr:integral rane protein TerC family [Bacteroidota bacterium]
MNLHELLFFGGFLIFIGIMLALDLDIFHKREHIVSTREATAWTIVWIMLSIGFYAQLNYFGDKIHGIDNLEDLKSIALKYNQPFEIISENLEASIDNYQKVLSLEYLTGYLIELSLSVDNIFVMILILSAFKVEKRYYHRVLFWGIIGAIVFRFLFIFIGAVLIAKFHWIIYIFAAFLIYTSIRMFLTREEKDEMNPEQHAIVKLASKYFAVHHRFEGNKFFIKLNGRRMITPLFVVLLIIEFTDLVFAVDSIPAIFAVTRDPYIVFFSNVFAILGLRSMFFLLLGSINKFHYFKVGLSALLLFIGLKMLLTNYLKSIGFTTIHSLIIIASIIFISIVASLLFPKKKNIEDASH